MKRTQAKLQSIPSYLIVRPSNDNTGYWYAEIYELDAEHPMVESTGTCPYSALQELEVVLELPTQH